MHPSRVCLMGLMLGLVAAMTCPAVAQDSLPSSVTQVEGSMDDGQRQAVDSYISNWSFKANDRPASISQKRIKLREPLVRPGASAPFRAQYSAKMATSLESALKIDNKLIHLNALIVGASLEGNFGLDLANRTITDDDPSVRFWACKAIARICQQTRPNSEEPVLNEAQRREELKVLADRVNLEPWAPVRMNLYLALVSLELADARDTLTAALNTWVDKYAAVGASADLKAEATAMAKLYTELLEAYVKADRKDAVKVELKRMVVVCYKYAQLIARDLDTIVEDEAALAVVRDMANSIERVMNQTIEIYDASAGPGLPIARPISGGKYAEFKFHVGEWGGKLTGAPLSIPKNTLQLPAKVEAPKDDVAVDE